MILSATLCYLFSRYFNAQNPIKLDVEQGVFILHDGQTFWALLLTNLQNSPNKLETLRDLVGKSDIQV